MPAKIPSSCNLHYTRGPHLTSEFSSYNATELEFWNFELDIKGHKTSEDSDLYLAATKFVKKFPNEHNPIQPVNLTKPSSAASDLVFVDSQSSSRVKFV